MLRIVMTKKEKGFFLLKRKKKGSRKLTKYNLQTKPCNARIPRISLNLETTESRSKISGKF